MIELIEATQRLIGGEHTDTTFETDHRITLAQCVAMAQAKTAALMQCACTPGAVCGGAEPDRGRLLGQFGAHLGMAFQVADDLLDNWGDPETTGLPNGSDLHRRKMSLPVAAALESGTDAAQQLAALYDRTMTGTLTETQITQAVGLLENTGARTWARGEIDRELRSARACLDAAVSSSADVMALTSLMAFISDRIP